MSYGSFLGYEKDDDGNIVINEREAIIVKSIYSRYLQGLSLGAITKELEDKKVKNVRGDFKWYGSTIKSMLQNEKYTGNVFFKRLLQLIFYQKKERLIMGKFQSIMLKTVTHPL